MKTVSLLLSILLAPAAIAGTAGVSTDRRDHGLGAGPAAQRAFDDARRARADGSKITIKETFDTYASVLDDWNAPSSERGREEVKARLLLLARSMYIKRDASGKNELKYPAGPRKGQPIDMTMSPKYFIPIFTGKDARQAGNLVFLDAEKKQLVIFNPVREDVTLIPVDDIRTIGTVTRAGKTSLVVLEQRNGKAYYSEFPDRGAVTLSKPLTIESVGSKSAGTRYFKDGDKIVMTEKWSMENPSTFLADDSRTVSKLDYQSVLSRIKED